MGCCYYNYYSSVAVGGFSGLLLTLFLFPFFLSSTAVALYGVKRQWGHTENSIYMDCFCFFKGATCFVDDTFLLAWWEKTRVHENQINKYGPRQ